MLLRILRIRYLHGLFAVPDASLTIDGFETIPDSFNE